MKKPTRKRCPYKVGDLVQVDPDSNNFKEGYAIIKLISDNGWYYMGGEAFKNSKCFDYEVLEVYGKVTRSDVGWSEVVLPDEKGFDKHLEFSKKEIKEAKAIYKRIDNVDVHT